MKQTLTALLGLMLASGLLVWYAHRVTQESEEGQTVISLSDMDIEIADTPEKRTQGLSGRTDIPAGYGMLFVFEEDSTPGFWMKDMVASIDIIWIKDTGEVVGLESQVSPDTYPHVFYAPEPVRYVLEVASGEAEKRGIMSGVRIEIPA